jgi:Ca2+-binding EF-hand superfamily protein
VVKTLIDSLQDFEIDSVFKELDRNNLGSIPVDEFVQKFGKE